MNVPELALVAERVYACAVGNFWKIWVRLDTVRSRYRVAEAFLALDPLAELSEDIWQLRYLEAKIVWVNERSRVEESQRDIVLRYGLLEALLVCDRIA